MVGDPDSGEGWVPTSFSPVTRVSQRGSAHTPSRSPLCAATVPGMERRPPVQVFLGLVLLVFGMRSGTTDYFDAALVIGMLGFVATAALAKFLLRGEVIE